MSDSITAPSVEYKNGISSVTVYHTALHSASVIIISQAINIFQFSVQGLTPPLVCFIWIGYFCKGWYVGNGGMAGHVPENFFWIEAKWCILMH